LAAERITVMVIRGGASEAGHGRPARMSDSHAGISLENFSVVSADRQGCFLEQLIKLS